MDSRTGARSRTSCRCCNLLHGRPEAGGGAGRGEGAGDKGGVRGGAPGISGLLSRGSLVSVSVRIGNDLAGYVCDSDGSGLLLEVRDPSGDIHGYEFLPWSSIERVSADER